MFCRFRRFDEHIRPRQRISNPPAGDVEILGLDLDANELAAKLDAVIPEGADKTYLLRKLREVAMWANVAITREADGTPRS